MREESGGILMGTYEQDHRPWSPRVTPWSFGSELLTPVSEERSGRDQSVRGPRRRQACWGDVMLV